MKGDDRHHTKHTAVGYPIGRHWCCHRLDSQPKGEGG
nr:MAG TPA: hypothetical protein [Caudoviricetes sp.]